MHVLNQSKEGKLFTGSRVKVLMSGKDTGGQFCMMEFQGPAGRSTPMHVHDREEETVHVLEGQLEVTIDNENVLVGPGETVLLRRHIPHRLATKGDVDARYIVVCVPAGFDDFVEACATEDDGSLEPSAPSPEDIARLKDQAPRFGITLLPPNPNR